jgi:hypothetical protein
MDELPHQRLPDSEARLEQIREEARSRGSVAGDGVHAFAGPMPVPAPEPTQDHGYYSLPILKPPVWEWMIAVYFFVGGLAGMSALIASAALLRNDFTLARVAMWAAGIGAVLSPILLTIDLGRPRRFLYMLRVFKYQSPMSVGSWIVTGFGSAALPGWGLAEWHWHNLQAGTVIPAVHILAVLAIASSALLGIFLATYTGALVAVTAIPAWNLHRLLLPFHFGMAGLGSAASTLTLAGFRLSALTSILIFSAAAETGVLFWLEMRKHGAADRALHEGRSGWTLRPGEVLAGPAALILAGLGQLTLAAAAFLLGSLLTRFGWLSAGRASACDPAAVLASQGDSQPISPQVSRAL